MTMAHTNTKTKCFKDPRYAIFFKSMGFKDINTTYDAVSDVVESGVHWRSDF